MKKLYQFLQGFFILSLIFSNISLKAQCDELIVDLGNDTLICEGGAIILDAGDGVLFNWSDGSTDQFLTITEPGTYFVSVTNECDENDGDTILIEMVMNPVINVLTPNEEYYCKGEIVTIEANVENPVGAILYEWINTTETEPVIDVDTTGNYIVTATDEYGCTSEKEISLEFQYPNEEEKILLVSYDPEEDKNIVVFSKTDGKRTMEYEFYYGTNTDNMMTIHDFSYNNLVIDQNTDPRASPRIYNMMVVDSCDNRSTFVEERGHKSMQVITTLDKDGNPLLEWNHYEGFGYDYFHILRGTSPDNLEVIDSVMRRSDDIYSFSDLKTQGGTTYYYQIRVNTPEVIYLENPENKKASRGPFVHSLSNLDDTKSANGLSDFIANDLYLKIYPNPFSAETRIKYKINKESHIRLEVYNILGEKVCNLFNGNQPAGNHEVVFQPEDYHLSKGMYYLRLENGKNINQSKILIFK